LVKNALFRNRSLRESHSKRLRRSAKAESSYRIGNFGRIFLVRVSAPNERVIADFPRLQFRLTP
jgi:hypothetical protein